jgi:hypothetical protein
MPFKPLFYVAPAVADNLAILYHLLALQRTVGNGRVARGQTSVHPSDIYRVSAPAARRLCSGAADRAEDDHLGLAVVATGVEAGAIAGPEGGRCMQREEDGIYAADVIDAPGPEKH